MPDYVFDKLKLVEREGLGIPTYGKPIGWDFAIAGADERHEDKSSGSPAASTDRGVLVIKLPASCSAADKAEAVAMCEEYISGKRSHFVLATGWELEIIR